MYFQYYEALSNLLVTKKSKQHVDERPKQSFQ